MPPKKRTTKKATAASATAATTAGGSGGRRPARRAASASNESGSGSDISTLALADLLRRLQTASKAKTRCTAALQALIDGQCPRPSASSAIDIDTAAKAAVAAMEAKTATGASVSSASGENEDIDAAERASQDASLIPLTTHVLQRLLTLLRDHASTTASASAAAASAGAKGSESKKKKKSKSTSKSAAAADANEEDDDEANQLQVQVAVVTIALSHSLTQLLLADRPRLEKCAHHTTAPASVSASASSKGGSAEDTTGCDARSLVGRAIVASSLSSLAGLEVLFKYGLVRLIGGGDDGDDASDQTQQRVYMSLLRSSAWSALRTMERLTHINLNPPSAVSPSGSGVQHSQVGYASPSVHYHASVASSDTVQAWRDVLKELCRGTELHLADGEKVGEDGAEDDDAESADQMDVDQDEEEEDADVKNSIASLIEEVCGIASDAASEKFPGEMEVLYAAINRVSVDSTAAAATSSGSKSKSSNKRPTRKAGKKRGASSQSSGGTASVAAVSLLSALHDSHRIVFDGRIAIRRWTPMSLVWFGVGQKALLDLATTILRSETEVDDGDDDGSGGAGPMSWSTVLAPLRGGMLKWSGNDGTISSTGNKRKRRSLSPSRGSDGDGDGSDGDAPPQKRSKSASGGKKRAAARSSSKTKKKGGSKKRPEKLDDDVSESGENPAKVIVPGNVALVAFASRLVDLANEIGLTCGAKAPVGGMEAYAREILEGMSGNGKTSKEGSRSKQKKKKSSKKASSSSNTFPSDSIRLPGGGPSFDDSWIRPDIRHEASALIRRILSVHSRCLRENFNVQALLSTGKRALPENGNKGDSNGSGRYLVNDDVLSGPQQLRETALCFPFMPRTLDVLARCAASIIPVSSASSSNSSTEVPRDSVSTCMSKMMALASALAIGGGSIVLSEETDDKDGDEGCFVIADARLSSMAVSTLMDCVKRIATTSSTSSGATSSVSGGDTSGLMPAELVQLYHLDKPLIPPSSGGELNESAKVDGFCSYGGALILLPVSAHSSSSASVPGDDGLGTLMGITSSAGGSSGQRHGGCLEDGDVLALFLRAMLEPSGDHQYTAEECAARLLTQILRIVGCCYARVSDLQPVARDSDVQAIEKMAFAKSALAADALDTLRKSLLIRPSSSSISSSKDRLRRCLRSCGLQLDHMRRLIDCSCSLENFFRDRVYSSRQAHKNKIEKEKTDERNANSDAEAVLDASTRRDKSCNEYDPAERRLWQSHVKCCLTFGRGKPGDLYTATNMGFSSEPILGDYKTRLDMHQLVAESFEQSSDLKLSWPLALPRTLHALITSNLSVEPLPKTAKEASPERRICDLFVSAISEALQDLTLVSNCMSDFCVPLSLNDSRMFLLALLRMPKKEQTKVLSKLVDSIHEKVVERSFDLSAGKSAEEKAASSGFLARLVTVAVAAVDSVRAGRHLLETLRMQTGSEHYHPPAGLYEDFTSKEDWYGRSNSFLSLYGDWEQSGVPVPDIIDGTEPLVKTSINKLITSFMILFDKSFVSAKDDHCHLLFSAWNALAECSVWDLKAPMPLESLATGDTAQYARSLIEMRQDMWAIHKRIVGASESHPDTMLFRGLTKKVDTGKFRSMQVPAMLKTAVEFAVDISNKAVVSLVDADKQSPSSSSAALSVYEGVAAYISFLISMHTKSDKTCNTYFGDEKLRKAGRRKGSGMSDSVEEAPSSDESDYDEDEEDEAKMAVLSKLHDACQAVGAAPVHPDWLDTSVRIRPGISPSAAAEAAKAALSSLSKLANAARIHREKSLQRALSSTSTEPGSESSLSDAALALRIHRSIQDQDASQSSAVAETLGFDKNLLSSLNNINCSCSNDATVRETWCTNSAQQIKGGFQECAATLEGWFTTSAELRATNEWEMLLSDSLVAACTNIAASQPDDLAAWRGDRGALGDSLDDAERWQNIVCACAEAMVPCAALLRLGLNCGRGRSQHPFSVEDQVNKEKSLEPNAVRPSSPLPDGNLVSFVSVPEDEIKSALATSIAVLSDVASESGKSHSDINKTCHAAMCHLLGDASQQENCEDLATVRFHLAGLCAFDQALSLLGASNDKRIPIRPDDVVVRIVNALDRKEVIPQLLAALGIDNTVKIDTLSERQVDATNLLRNAQKQFQTLSDVSSNPDIGDSLLPWTWGEQPQESLSLLMKLLFKKTHNLASASRAAIARLLGNVLVAEADHLLSTASSSGNTAVVLPIIAKAWNELDQEEVNRVILGDICCIQKEDGSDDLSKNIGVLLTQLCCSDSSTVQLVGEDSYLFAAQAMVTSIKDWAVLPDNDVTPKKMDILEHQMELLFALATRTGGGEHDGLLKKAGEELLTLASGERPSVQTKKGKAKSDRSSADSRYLPALERFFYFVHALNKRMNQMDLDSGSSTAGTHKQQKGLSSNSNSTSADQDRAGVGDDNEKSEFYITKSGAKVWRTCTFIDTGGDFKEQHWYNCYTCGLLWDKGCCTLCALTCHRDHDVGYSRKSSFFCDCGAEVASAGEENRVTCRCLSPLSSKELSTIYEEPESTKKEDRSPPKPGKQNEPSPFTDAFKDPASRSDAHSRESTKRTIDALVRRHPDHVDAAVNKVIGEIKSSWGERLVEVFDGCFHAWSQKVKNPDTLSQDGMSPSSASTAAGSDVGSTSGPRQAATETVTGASSCLPDLSLRSGRTLSLSKIQGNAMIPVRAAKASSVTVKLSNDPSTDRIKKALLSKNSIKRSALVSDSRGRIVVSEPNSLFFCSALPLVNVRYPTASSSSPPFDRNQLCCLGSHKVDFCIVGMQFCPENDRHLVVWGTAEVSIIVLSKKCDKVEKKIDLVIELEPHECDSEYLLKCEWLPSSETHVAVFCGTFVKVFDARRSTISAVASASAASASNSASGGTAASDRCKQYSCSSTTCYTLAYEDALIRSAAVVPLDNPAPSSNEDGKADQVASSCAKMFLLFDSGRIHGIDIAFDSNCDLDDQGEIYIESIGGMSFPTAGVRRYSGAVPGAVDSVATTFGEGSSLEYLEQSGLLLYKCLSSCVVAFVIDKQSGDITGSFEFLPQVVSSSMLGSGLDGYSISAPYANWTELGTYEKDGTVHYRVVCTGKSTRTNQPKLLLVEYGVDSVHVMELSWTGGSTLGLGLSLNTSFEGIAAFSAPVIEDASDSGSFYERAYVAALTSNGSILVYGEDLSTKDGVDPFRVNHAEISNIVSNHPGVATHVSTSSIGENNAGQPKFPLTIFETLENFSHSQELVLGGDGIGKDQDTVKRKLSIHNGDFFLSPSRDGCTLTLALQQSKSLKPSASVPIQIQNSSGGGASPVSVAENFRAIVAVRLLLGSTTTDYIPRQVSVMGRVIKLSQGVKRWYDLPLTNEEIMLGIRSGFVTLSISSSFDSSNNPLIDAMEVYALPTDELPFAVPPASPRSGNLSPSTESGAVATSSSFGIDDSSQHKQNEMAVRHDCVLEQNGGGENSKLQLSLLSAVRAAQIAHGSSPHSDQTFFIDRKFILRSIEVTALETTQSKDQSVRQNVMDLVQTIDGNKSERDFLVDGGTLSGIRKAMTTLLIHVERFCGGEKTSTTGSSGQTSEGAMEVDTDLESPKFAIALAYLPNILSALNDCLSTALAVARGRPANYLKSHWESTEGKRQTLAWVAGKILTPALSFPGASTCKGFALASANVVELAIRETGMEWAASVDSPTFDLVAKFLKCTDKEVVRVMAKRMVEMSQMEYEDKTAGSSDNAASAGGKSKSESEKPPIAYQCDGCETFPIQRVRFTLEVGHDIDLCQGCYDEGVQYARSSAPDVAAYINGKSFYLNTGEAMTCTDLLSMKRVSVGDEVLEDVRMSEQASDNEEDAALQLALAMSMSTEPSQKAKSPTNAVQEVTKGGDGSAGTGGATDPNIFVSPLFDGLLDLVSASMKGGSTADVKHIDILLDCLLQLVESSGSEETQIKRGKKMADILCGAISSIVEKPSPTTSGDDEGEDVVVIDGRKKGEKMNLNFFALSSLVNGRTTVAASRDVCSTEASASTIVTTDVVQDVVQDGGSGKSKGSAGHKDKTDPRFVCDIHGVPAVRRRCSRGVHKDRRFYVCGMERKSRCKYFRWADEAADEGSQPNKAANNNVVASHPPNSAQHAIEPPSPALKAIQEYLWHLLTVTDTKGNKDQKEVAGSLSLSAQMYKLVDNSFKRLHPSGSQTPDVSFSTTVTSDDASAFRLDSLVDKNSKQEDLCDGVNLSRDKLRHKKLADGGEEIAANDNLSVDSNSHDACTVYASLDLLGSVASPTKHGDLAARGNWIPLLCEIIGTGQHSNVRGQAKRLLKRLCGGKSNYHRVRDHYIFGFQYKALLGLCVDVLEAALIARERGRQCGQNWREDTLVWGNMSAGSLIGTSDLVSEDASPVKCIQKIHKAFDDLIDLTKNRSNNWRHFCALSKLPQNGGRVEGGTLASLAQTSPIVTLLWIASSLPKHSDKALRLIEIALTARPLPGTEGGNAGMISTDVGTDFNTDTNDLSPGKRDSETPEQALLFGDHNGLKSDEVYAFVMQFVLRGRTHKIRSSAKRIGHALSHVLAKAELEAMFAKFITNSLREVQTFGESSVEFLEFLQALATCRHNSSPSSNIGEIAELAVTCLTRQLSSTIQVLRSDDASVEVELEAGSGQYMKKCFDLSSCAHCHREQVAALRLKSAMSSTSDGASEQGPSTSTSSGQGANRSNSSSRRHETTGSESGSTSQQMVPGNWLDDQVRPYTKSSLESSTESSISAEFTSYVKLKCRMAISEVHLSASDPRGRFVKTVAVYFSPRHVGKVEDLKKDDYLPIWQHCGNLSLSRGATRASFKLNTPVVAANLKFEYAEFHEKANNGRSADGGLILHCPRCTRVVNNAHGVCGHCGEVAFQCRKCRHINYDKLDAFLCVECGYCAYASFNYELTAGIASNAVAITNEEDYERGVRLLRAAAKRQSDLRDHKLRKKLLFAAPARRKRAREIDLDDLGWLNSHSPQMKRAMLGELPKSGKSDGGHGTDSSSRRKSLGHGGSGGGTGGGSAGDRSSASSRARSLLSLARQLRDEASGRSGGGGDGVDGERLSRGDMLVRQALLGGSAGSSEMAEDDAADMLGLLSGNAGPPEGDEFGFEDPLSRLVADIEGRAREGNGAGDPLAGADSLGVGGGSSRRRSKRDRDGGAGGGGGSSDGNNHDAKSSGRDSSDPRETMEELETLHQQMREAERECFELRTKLNAWTRLNCDRIADTGSSSRVLIFTPTTCGPCCSKVTLSMLLLVVSLLQHAVEAVTPNLVRILFEDSLGGHDHDDLVRYRRWAIVKIALLSERAADMVLNELRQRLKASQDTNSAQILGSILSKDGVNGAERFVALAEDVLSGRL